MTYQELDGDQLAAFREITDHAFGRDGGDAEPFGEPRGVVVDGTVASVCQYVPLSLAGRGGTVPAGGIADVATRPGRRRAGHVGTLLREVLREFRSRGLHAAVLWPSQVGFYANFGWGRPARYVEHTTAPGRLPGADERLRGRVRRVGADRVEDLSAVYDAHVERFLLAVDRTPAWWTEQVLAGEDHCALLARDGAPRAYVRYRVDGDTLAAVEYACEDPAYYPDVLSFLGNYDSQVDTVRLTEPRPAPLSQVTSADGVTTELVDGPMFRLVDVPAAVSGLAADGVEPVTLAVRDRVLPGNDGTVELSAEGGTVSCTRVEDADPDGEVDVATLSALYAGTRTVEGAATYAGLDADERCRETLATLFPRRPTYLPEFF